MSLRLVKKLVCIIAGLVGWPSIAQKVVGNGPPAPIDVFEEHSNSAIDGAIMKRELDFLDRTVERDGSGDPVTRHAELKTHLIAKITSAPETIHLWSDEQLGLDPDDNSEIRRERRENDAWIGNVNRPTLTVYHPTSTHSSRTAMMVCPGGGYGGLVIEKEGHRVAQWLAEKGITAGVLKYRCGGNLYQYPIPLQDAARAIEILRAHSDRWSIADDQIGVIGFSAGGHLASLVATDPRIGVNFAALIYPVVSMDEAIAHVGCKRNLLGSAPSQELVHNLSSEHRVSPSTCPTFLVHAGDDLAVSVQHSLRFYQACILHGVSAEMHLFPVGGHGFGMYRDDRPVDRWPAHLTSWLIGNGWCQPTSQEHPVAPVSVD